MTNAATGNSMIPSYPGIAQQQVRDGAQTVAPQYPGAAPRNQQPAPQAPATESVDFWAGIEKAIEPQQENYEGLYEQPSPAPQQQPQAQPDGQGQPSQPQPQGQPSAEPQLTQEQQYAIWEASSQGAPSPQAQQPQAPQAAPQQDYSALETQAIERLAASEYALPAEQAQLMVSEPEKVYPQLAARLHVRLASQIGQAVQQMLPSIVDNMVQQRMAAVELENQFYRSYPQLADPRFKPVVAASLRAVRQANPQASREQVMADGAAFAAMKLRLNLQAQNQGQPQQMAVPRFQPNGQQAPQYQVPTQPQAQQYPQQPVAPFQPAVGGGVGLPTNPQAQQNEFEVLANDPNW